MTLSAKDELMVVRFKCKRARQVESHQLKRHQAKPGCNDVELRDAIANHKQLKTREAELITQIRFERGEQVSPISPERVRH